jgi:hypothetical protein
MAIDWVEERLRKHQQRLQDERQRGQWQANAVASYQTFFDNLWQQMRGDVIRYNELFGAMEGCKADLRWVDSGNVFEAVCPKRGNTVRVSKNPGSTMISVQWSQANDTSLPRHKSIEVTPDDQGKIRYRLDNGFAKDTSEVSAFILNDVLCE